MAAIGDVKVNVVIDWVPFNQAVHRAKWAIMKLDHSMAYILAAGEINALAKEYGALLD